ncbi:hypothetical protein [uncultured Acinetobacter sp.]|uniref:hypothetical protein n=1 Tax=uncultured Acinetobacter sp. TaxID=165433 RepID=UPI00258F1035|nr:hypothetical protein [uncultured Acinetobacter sp.]
MIDLELERKAFNDWHFLTYGEFVNWWDDAPASWIHNDRWKGWISSAESKQAEIDSLKGQLTEYTKAALDVLGERNRQIEQEHYSIEHDDSYQNNELPRAAASYVNNVVSRGWVFNSAYGPEAYQSEEVPDLWPWSDKYWKPKNPRRDLVKAAALIIAEIDRMDRSSAGRAK